MLDYQQRQADFAAHIRNPEKYERPSDVEDRRMKIYRDLFYNNIEGFLAGGFPIFKSLFDEASWAALVRHFIDNHQSETPYFLEITEEFMQYLEQDELPLHADMPFAKALAHYEWVELALDVANEHAPTSYNPNGDLLKHVPLISAVAWPLVYQWPVHLIGEGYRPDTPSDTPFCLVVYRSRTDTVEFMEANPVTIRLLEIMTNEENLTGEAALTQLADEMHSDPASIIQFGLPILEQLRSQGIILGALV